MLHSCLTDEFQSINVQILVWATIIKHNLWVGERKEETLVLWNTRLINCSMLFRVLKPIKSHILRITSNTNLDNLNLPSPSPSTNVTVWFIYSSWIQKNFITNNSLYSHFHRFSYIWPHCHQVSSSEFFSWLKKYHLSNLVAGYIYLLLNVSILYWEKYWFW